ncbi:cryptochrome/photolyase family protein [Arenimonas sp.]|nr:cryptochrome/photolyase family protein [Candidatus Parcubacteria bacterium]
MKEATLIYPHQLFVKSPAIKKGRMIFLIEESLILSHNPIHYQKLVLHKLSMDAYEESLKKDGYKIQRLTIEHYLKTVDVFKYLIKEGIQIIHVVDTTDYYLERAIEASKIKRVWYESSLFILPKEESIARYKNSNKNMGRFYKKVREDLSIMMDGQGKPRGGEWSFDADNQKKLSKSAVLPKDVIFENNFDVLKIKKWLDTVKAEKYGDIGCWLPYTHKEADIFLESFFKDRFRDFGVYEDALTEKSVRLFHSTLSPLINIGLLEPKQVIDRAIEFADTHTIPINSLEGFVRQIIGWREFMRATYECDGVVMRTKNFWKHTRSLPVGFWTGDTGIRPVDSAIKKALHYGYNHHIERLMVLGNFMLLSQVNPDHVYRWFMAMYIDAYDWVMVPNVYGMSQFADGGIFATKPYISGSNYIKKMSDYLGGDWEEKWTALYWNFIASHHDFFISNHRLSMMPRLYEKMEKNKKENYLKIAKEYLLKK